MNYRYYCDTTAPKRVRDRGRRYDTLKERVSSQEHETQRLLEVNLRLFLETGRKAF